MTLGQIRFLKQDLKSINHKIKNWQIRYHQNFTFLSSKTPLKKWRGKPQTGRRHLQYIYLTKHYKSIIKLQKPNKNIR